MPLVTKSEMKTELKQLADTTEYDALLDSLCLEAEAIVSLYLGFSFDGYAAETVKTVYGSGLPWLELPPHEAGSITSLVYEGSTTEITGWTEDSEGRLYWAGYPRRSLWHHMARYTVTANWGYGGWPAELKRVGKELVANFFTEAKTGHFSDVQGVQGAGGDIAVGYANALTKRQKMILDQTIQRYMGVTV